MAKKPRKKNKSTAIKAAVDTPKPEQKISSANQRAADSTQAWILSAATILLTTAAAVCVLMILAVMLLPDGRLAAAAIGGFPSSLPQARTMQWFMLLDTLFPLFYGSGFAALAAGMQIRGNRPVIRLALTAILIGVVADFAENSSIFSAMQSTGDVPGHVQLLTVIKYASLAFAGVLISAVMPAAGVIGILARTATRYVFPVGIAIMVSMIGGEIARGLVGLGFPVGLILLAVYAQALIGEEPR